MESTLEILILAFVGVFGACIGSFLNVVAYRLPRACMSVARPRSRCPRCATPIPWHGNLPVLSWLLLRGRCRSCRARISPRYPLVELLTGLIFAWNGYLLLPRPALSHPQAFIQSWLALGVAELVVSVLIALSLIDLDFRVLPDKITLPGILLAPGLAFLAPHLQPSLVIGSWFPDGTSLRLIALLHGLLGALSGAGGLWLIGWLGKQAFHKEAMGLGDVKMMGAMGGLLGLWVFLALAIASVAGAVVGILVLLVKRNRRIPFGPFLAAGHWLVMMRGQEILHWYLNVFRMTG